MGTRAEQSLASEEGRMQRLAEDLRSESSSNVILKRLKALNLALGNQLKADSRAHLFLQAGGLPTVIHLLKGNPLPDATLDATADADSLRSAISTEAGHAVNRLVSCRALTAERLPGDSVMRSLIYTLRDAPSDVGRIAAAQGLLWLAEAKSANRKAMAKAGVMGLLMQCLIEMDESAWAMQDTVPVWSVGCVLLRQEGIARRELQQAICGAQADQAFAALHTLHECLASAKQDIGSALYKDGLVDALVTTLNHESPYCVAAAAGGLSLLCTIPATGPALLRSSGAIPALVGVIKRGRPAAEAKTGLYGRSVLKVGIGSHREDVHYNNPTAMALGALLIIRTQGGLAIDMSPEAGTVPALVRLLKESTCPQTLVLTAMIIEVLMQMDTTPGRLADCFFESGLCQSALQALSMQTRAVRGWVLVMLTKFSDSLSDQFRAASMAELVAGNAVELTLAYMTEAGLHVPRFGLEIFNCFFKDPRARERICGPAVAGRLLKWGADLLPEADGPDMLRIVGILTALLQPSPWSIHAPGKGNLVPGLVCALRKLQNPRGVKGCHPHSIERPLGCLRNLLLGDMGGTGVVRKAAITAGIVPILMSDLLTEGHDSTRVLSVEVSGLLLTATPRGEAGPWGVGLVRAIAQLLGAAPPAARLAADMLSMNGLVHPELFVDCRTWGIDDAVRRLTMDSDPGTAAVALKLQNLFSLDKAVKVKGRSARGGPVTPSASTSTPPPSPRKGQTPGTPRPMQHTRPEPTSTSALVPTLTRSDGRHSAKAGSCARRDQGKLSVAPVPKSHGERMSRPSASPGRCGGPAVRACAHFGMRTEKSKLKECSACRSVRYCGKACQTADWPAHKATCKCLQAACH